MPEFKKGDRVRYTALHTAYNEPQHIGATGTVSGVPDSTTVYVDWDKAEGRSPSWNVYTANLGLVTPEPYVPQVGDRVRVTYEGRVTGSSEVLGDVRVFTDTGHSILTGRSAKSIELLEKATPQRLRTGTVVDDGRGVWLVGDKKVSYTYHHGELIYYGTPEDLAKKVRENPSRYKIVHEPPTS